MPDIKQFLQNMPSLDFTNLLITAVVIFILVIVQRIALGFVGKKEWADETMHLRIHTQVRNAFLTLMIICVVAIWIPQIQAFAFSIAAIAVAIAISLKEAIMMFAGGLIRASTDLLTIGDRIEVNGCEGDVVRVGFFTTTLSEVGPTGQRTGRIMHIPNSFYFTYPVSNEMIVGNYTFHLVNIPVATEKYSEELRLNLLEYATELTKPYENLAYEHFRRFTQKNAMARLEVTPKVRIQATTYEYFDVIVRIVTPLREKVEIEQKILHKYAELIKTA